MKYPSKDMLQCEVENILKSPLDNGVVDLIVCRPEIGERKLLYIGQLCTDKGLVGDNWYSRGSSKTSDGNSHPGMQLTLMNSRVVASVAGHRKRWKLAGDQLFVDFNLSPDNVSHGTMLYVGTAVIEISSIPHTGCKKFIDRFGKDAMRFISSGIGGKLNFRGVNAIVIKSGFVKIGDSIRKSP